MNLSQIQEFKLSTDRWSTYVSRMRALFEIHDVKPAEYSKYLVAVVGTEPLDLMIDLCFPEKPEKVDFETLVKLVADHLAPKRSIIAERMIFRSCKQTDSQTVTEYLAQIKKLSKTCKFTSTESLKENLRDQLVFGLKSDKIRQRLLTETQLTFDKAVELALSLEAAVRDAQEATSSSSAEKVHAVGGSGASARGAVQRGARAHRYSSARGRNSSGNSQARQGSQGGVKCYRCEQQHRADKCPFSNVECFVCGIRGHVARACRQRKRGGVHQLAVEEASPLTSSEDDDDDVYQLSDNDEDKRWLLEVAIEGKIITMEGDTGAGMSIINRSVYEKYFSDIELSPRKSNLRMYNGLKVKPMGEFRCSVTLDNKTVHDLDLIVIDNYDSSSLFGRKWMRAFKIDFPSTSSTQNVANIKEKLDTQSALKALENQFPGVFSPGIGAFNKGQVDLEVVPGARAVWRRARTVPYALRPAVEAELERLEREGIITPVEWSDWGTPVVPVVKKSGEVRLCGDFKTTLNPVLVDDKYPLPRIDDIFASLQGGKIFNKIDLSRAYQQLILSEDSKKYCTIVTHKGMFTYNRLPFGVKCAASKFQRTMEKLFRMPNVAVYQDDLLISSRNERESLEMLTKVFKILSECGLKVEKKKCSFFKKSVSYLGYVIDASGLRTEISKIDAINNTPQPSNVSELKAFLGLVNYYGKFVHNLSDVLEPLYALLKSNTDFIWSRGCESAFKQIKKQLSEAPILAHWEPSLATFVTCDASPHGVGAVLSQRARDGTVRPVLHASRTLSPAERNYAQICREGLAIIFAINKFHDYLYGNKFTLITDCKPLASIFSEKKPVPSMAGNRLQRWAIILSAYNYEVKCIGSKHNCVADSLSRLPVIDENKDRKPDSYIKFIAEQAPINYKIIAKHTTEDTLLQKVIHAIKSNWAYCKDKDLKGYYDIKQYLNVEYGCILFGHRVIVPETLRQSILEMLHACHQGIVKCKSVARGYVYWPGIDNDIERECRECETCARAQPNPPRAPIHPWAWPQVPWYRLHVDFFSLDNHTYFVLVDAHSKWIEAHRIGSTSAKVTIAKLRQIFSQFGLPQELVSDNGPPFTSHDFKLFLESCSTKHILVSPYKPSSNGAAESSVKIIKNCLKKALSDKIDIDVALDKFMLAYRTTTHSLTGKTPAELLLNRKLRTQYDMLRPDVNETIICKQQAMTKGRQSQERSMAVGDKILFKCFRHNKSTWEKGIINKRIGPLSYLVSHDGKLLKKHIDHLIMRYDNDSKNRYTEQKDNIVLSDEDSCDFNVMPYPVNDNTNLYRGREDDSVRVEAEPTAPTRLAARLDAPLEPNEVRTPKRIRKPVDRYVPV